jgi:AraC-like DNA-binding protein
MDTPLFPWPLAALPEITMGGNWRFGPAQNGIVYREPTVALHIYQYAGEIQIGGHRFPLCPGDLTVTPPDTPSVYRADCAAGHWCVHFKPVAAAAGHCIPLPLHLTPGPEEGAYLTERLERVIELWSRPAADALAQAAQRQAAAAALQELLLGAALLFRNQATSRLSGRLENALRELRQLVEERLAQPLTVPGLARSLGVSRAYLCRAFRQRYNLTIPRYILTRRVAAAKLLLQQTSLPVKEIAGRCGLPDPKHFARQFRLLTGRGPQGWRAGGQP